MAKTPRISAEREVDYPTSDGRPMAETDLHRQDMVDLIQTLQDRFAADPDVYVSGNLLLFYDETEARQHAEEARQRAEEAQQRVEGENERLRRELEAFQRERSGGA